MCSAFSGSVVLRKDAEQRGDDVHGQRLCRTELLPDSALQLVATHSSTLNCPASCTWSLVSHGWQAAGDRTHALNICLQPGKRQWDARRRYLRETAAAAAEQQRHAAAAAQPAAAAAGPAPGEGASARHPSPPVAEVSLSSCLEAEAACITSFCNWLVTKGRRQRIAQLRISFCFAAGGLSPRGGWKLANDPAVHAARKANLEAVCAALGAPSLAEPDAAAAAPAAQDASSSSSRSTPGSPPPAATDPAAPLRLTSIHLSTLGTLPSATTAALLGCCRDLQYLKLDYGWQAGPLQLDLPALATGLQQLHQLKELYLQLPRQQGAPVPLELTALLSALPKQLQQLQLFTEGPATFQLAALDHLQSLQEVNLGPAVAITTSSGTSGYKEGAGLTALTKACYFRALQPQGCRLLQSAALQQLNAGYPDAAVLQQLRYQRRLRRLTLLLPASNADAAAAVAQALSGVSHLQQLDVSVPGGFSATPAAKAATEAYAEGIGQLRALQQLKLQQPLLLSGGAALLEGLQQLEHLSVDCTPIMEQQEEAEAEGRDPADATGSSSGGGNDPLQRAVAVMQLLAAHGGPRLVRVALQSSSGQLDEALLAERAQQLLPGVEVVLAAE